MDKKGSITLFIVLILGVILSLVYLMQPVEVSYMQDQDEFFNLHVESCIEKSVLSGIDKFGLEQRYLSHYLNETLMDCLETEILDEMGYEHSLHLSETDVSVGPKTINAKADLGVLIEKGKKSYKRDIFQITIPRYSSMQLDSGWVRRGSVLVSPDQGAYIEFPQDTFVVHPDGTPAQKISFGISDKNRDGLENSIVAGEFLFEGLPDGVRFEPYARLVVELDEGFVGESLSIAWFDREGEIWRSIPFEVNENTIEAEITHFSDYSAVLGCNPKDTSLQPAVMNFGYIYREPFYPCDVYWEIDENIRSTNPYTKTRDYLREGITDVHTCMNPGGSPIFSSCICGLDDWDNNASTPDTLGYNKASCAGGISEVSFQLQPGGESCMPDESAFQDLTLTEISTVCNEECNWILYDSADNIISSGDGTGVIPRKINANEEYVIRTFIINSHGPCSDARLKLRFLAGTGILKQCIQDTDIILSGSGANQGILVTSPCQCGYKNVAYDPDFEQYCCFNGEVVHHVSECSRNEKCKDGTTIKDSLNINDDGCVCEGEVFKFSDRRGPAYCCRIKGDAGVYYGIFSTPCEDLNTGINCEPDLEKIKLKYPDINIDNYINALSIREQIPGMGKQCNSMGETLCNGHDCGYFQINMRAHPGCYSNTSNWGACDVEECEGVGINAATSADCNAAAGLNLLLSSSGDTICTCNVCHSGDSARFRRYNGRNPSCGWPAQKYYAVDAVADVPGLSGKVSGEICFKTQEELEEYVEYKLKRAKNTMSAEEINSLGLHVC